MNLQPWRLVAISNQQWLTAFGKEAAKVFKATHNPNYDENRNVFYDAPAAIFVFAQEQCDWEPGNPDWAGPDCGMLTQNIQLAAEAHGLGTCVVGMMRLTFEGEAGEAYRKELSMPEGWKPLYAVILGYPQGPAPGAKPRDLSRIQYID